jgi:hypothetical protein
MQGIDERGIDKKRQRPERQLHDEDSDSWRMERIKAIRESEG